MIERILASAFFAATFPPVLLWEFLRATTWEHRRWIIAMFCCVYSSTMVLNASSDGARHLAVVEQLYTDMDFTEFTADLGKMLLLQLTESGAKDPYKHVLSYLFGGVLGAPVLFFPAVGLIYGYFYSGCLVHVLRRIDFRNANYLVLSLAFAFAFFKGLDGIQTVRTWTGMWVLLYACLNYFERRDVRYLLLMCVPPFIHIGYLAMALPAVAVLLLGNREILYGSLLIVSSFTNFIPTDAVVSRISQTERGAYQINAYKVEEESAQLADFNERLGSTSFYNAYVNANLHRWSPTLLIISALISGAYLRQMRQYPKSLFSIGVLTVTLSNLTWFNFALHNRSITVSIGFLLASTVMYFASSESTSGKVEPASRFRVGTWASIILLAPWLMFVVSNTLNCLSVYLFALPAIPIIFPESNISVKQMLNFILGRGE